MRAHMSAPAAGVLAIFVLGGMEQAFAQSAGRSDGDPGGEVTVTACVVREADYTRSTQDGKPAVPGPQLLLTDADSGRATYSLTGTRESDINQHIGQRVQITGSVESPRTTPVLSATDGTRSGSVNTGAPGAAGVTPEGGAAHEPSDALAATIKAGRVSEPASATGDPVYEVARLPRLNAASVRRVPGTCAQPAAQVTRAPAASNVQEPARPSPALRSTPQARTIVVRGCLARQTGGGTALTEQVESRDPLVLIDAVLEDDRPVEVISAVPGSAPTGAGSGTVPNTAGTTGAAPVDVGKLTVALGITTAVRAELAKHVGQRVEIEGTADDDTAGRAPGDTVAQPAGVAPDGARPPVPDAAHPSAPTRRVTVSTFRAIGGVCR